MMTTLKTRREKLEAVASLLTKVDKRLTTKDVEHWWAEDFRNLHKACLALSEPDAPEITVDEVFEAWQKIMLSDAKDFLRMKESDGSFYHTTTFAQLYRQWHSTRKPAKVYAFEVTDDLVKEFRKERSEYFTREDSDFEVRATLCAVRDLTAKDAKS